MNSTQNLRITPKRLGLISLDKYCPRCLWYRLKMRFREPFNFFGGAIFKHMELAQMAVVRSLLADKGSLPKEFGAFTSVVDLVEYPRNWRKFKHVLANGTEIYGEPDEVFKLRDGTLAVVDHKTAQLKADGDPLMPMYETQLRGYSLIAEEGLQLGTVTKGGLWYWSSQHDGVIADPARHYTSGVLTMKFAVKTVDVNIDSALLKAPIEEAEKVWKATAPPDGAEGCGDCKKLQALLLICEAKDHVAVEDRQLLLRRAGHGDTAAHRKLLALDYQDRWGYVPEPPAVVEELQELAFDEAGVMANWDSGL